MFQTHSNENPIQINSLIMHMTLSKPFIKNAHFTYQIPHAIVILLIMHDTYCPILSYNLFHIQTHNHLTHIHIEHVIT